MTTTPKTIPNPQGSPAPPSEFLKAGFPSCSIFREAWHEMAAECYLIALVLHGDVWQALTPEEVQEACRTPDLSKQFSFNYAATINHERMQRVADKLTAADDARAFSGIWRHVGNVEAEPAKES